MQTGVRYGLNISITTFLTLGTVVALYNGILAWWRHYVLRFLLWRSQQIPWNFIQLLDEATQRILLGKTGGGYRFFHDLLRDHFAAQYATSSPPSSSLLKNPLFTANKGKGHARKGRKLFLPVLTALIMILMLPTDAVPRFQLVPSKDIGHVSHAYVARLIHADAYLVKLQAKNMSAGPSGPRFLSHIDAYMKVDLNNGNWIEIGILSGYFNWPDNQQKTSRRVDYGFYWADSAKQDDLNPDNDIYWVHPIASIIPDGRDHELAITSQGGNRWFIYVDGKVQGISLYTGSSTAIGQTIGLKLAGGDRDGCYIGASADAFKMEPLTWDGNHYTNWNDNPSIQRRDASFKISWINHYAILSKNVC